MTTKTNTSFINLTWEDLNEWAGERIVKRGKSYQRSVEDLRITSDGTLLATVHGTEVYSTQAWMDDNGELFSECTCPYSWGPCKHVVAVILVYLDACKNKQSIPLAASDDERILELSGEKDDTDDFNGSDYEAECEDDNDVEKRRIPSEKSNRVRSHLEGLSKKELVDLVMNGENVVPELGRKLADRDNLKKGDIGKLVASIRKEIEAISNEPAWTSHWNDEGEIPDYSPVKKRLGTLLSNNHADAVVDLGAYLMERGIRQIEQSNDEGETGMEIASCMEVVFKAVMQSSLNTDKRLLWDIDLHLQDQYGILDGLKGPVAIGKASQSDWSKVADVLSERLDKLPKRQAGEEKDFPSKYRRERIMHWLLHALEKAGRKNEINSILEKEVPHTDCYVDLVRRLLQDKKIEEARKWAHKGYAATIERYPGIASNLEEMLREIALSEKNFLLATAYAAFEFFERPCVEKYSQLEQIAIKAGVWETVRGHIIAYLEQGVTPKGPTWPLPPLELKIRQKTSRGACFPDTETLIDIAIKERHHDDALKWYSSCKKAGSFGGDYTGEKVAHAVQTSHPDEALSIWKRLVDREISQAKPKAYQVAGGYLKKMKVVYNRINKPDAWTRYMAELREANKRRPRMLDVLNSLEGQRTRIVP